MPKRSKIATQLPQELKAWLDERLVNGNFSDYTAITAELNAMIEPMGFTISRSVVHSHGKEMQDKLAKMRETMMLAKVMEENFADEGAAMSGAVIGMAQTELFEVLLAVQALGDETDPVARAETIGKIGRSIADLSRASLSQKKHAAAYREKVQAVLKQLEHEVGKKGGKGGLDANTLARVKREIYGIT